MQSRSAFPTCSFLANNSAPPKHSCALVTVLSQRVQVTPASHEMEEQTVLSHVMIDVHLAMACPEIVQSKVTFYNIACR